MNYSAIYKKGGLDVKIYLIGYKDKKKKDFYIERPNGTGYYTILLTHTASIFTFDGEDILVPPNSLIFYDRFYPQYFKSDGNEYVHSWIHFSTDENDDYIFQQGIEMNKFHFFNEATTISQIFELLNLEFYSKNQNKDISIKLCFDLLLTKISEKINTTLNPVNVLYHNEFNRIRTKIYNSPANKWTVKDLANSVGLSESHFQHLYKEQFGTSVITDVINSRIKTAKTLLVSTSMSLARIAEETGYGSTSLFIRQFKAATAQTPTAYRKQYMIYNHIYRYE